MCSSSLLIAEDYVGGAGQSDQVCGNNGQTVDAPR